MRGFKLVAAVAVMALVGAMVMPAPAEAQTPQEKLKRGITNTAFGWIELPGTIKQEANNTNPVQGLTVGTIKGAYRALRRTVVGVYEIISFPFDVPPGYGPIVNPEDSWDYFD